MFRLIQLELKKYRLAGIIRGAFIANLCIFVLIALVSITSIGAEIPEFTGFEGLFEIIDVMVRATFIIFAGVLLSKLIIDEFKSQSITVLFMYPINRKKLIIAKLLIVITFTFTAIILSAIFLTCAIYLLDQFIDIIPGTLTLELVLKQGTSFVTGGLAASFMSLIPLYFGLRKQSTVSTLVASIIIVLLVCSNNGGFSLNAIIIVPIILACIGVLIAYLSIRNIEHVDLLSKSES
ncbi:ABC transporter permease [Paenibacillus sp. FSL K6-2524]|uniref:ABC transporter permease n=1 Tax=Paenibacillus sp. FSL K6-2524 TaxID=2954516 RepID=UPI0030F9EDAE